MRIVVLHAPDLEYSHFASDSLPECSVKMMDQVIVVVVDSILKVVRDVRARLWVLENNFSSYPSQAITVTCRGAAGVTVTADYRVVPFSDIPLIREGVGCYRKGAFV